MAELPTLDFGMYRGRRLDEVPDAYVRWLAHPARELTTRRNDRTYRPLDPAIVAAARERLMDIERRGAREDFASFAMSGSATGLQHPIYVVDTDGDCMSRSGSNVIDGHCFQTLEATLGYLSSEYPIDSSRGPGRRVSSGRSTPDAEDDRILVWEVLPSGHRKVVWGFFGWHWSEASYACGQGTLPGDNDTLYAIASRR